MATKLAVVIENDGEVAVLIPFDGRAFDYRRAYTQRRVGIATPQEFQEQYRVIDEQEEAKERVFDELGITKKELNAAMKTARSEGVKCQNLRQLVQACRKRGR